MLDVILTVIDRYLKLLEHDEKKNREYYIEFVKPLLDDLDEVHSDYLTSFKQYQAALTNSKHTLNIDHPIIRTLRTDAIFSEDIRRKLQYSNIEPSGFIAHSDDINDLIGDFVDSISDYINCAATNPLDASYSYSVLRQERLGISNFIRMEVETGIERILSSDHAHQQKLDECLLLIDHTVLQLQFGYSQIYASQLALKRALLKSK
ncbi:MAG: hypothetical protein AAFX54_11400 [Pseudomonadota bacterium]